MKSDADDILDGMDEYLNGSWEDPSCVYMGFEEDDFHVDFDHLNTKGDEDTLQPSLDAIDDLCKNHNLNEHEVLKLKGRCEAMYEALIIQRRSEQRLMEEAKRFAAIIEKQKVRKREFDAFDEHPYNDDDDDDDDNDDDVRETTGGSERQNLRDKLLQCSNDLKDIELEKEESETTLNVLKGEILTLQYQVTRLQKSENQDHMKMHLEALDSLEKQVMEKNQEFSSLKENVDLCMERNREKQKEIESLRDTLSHLQESYDVLEPQIQKAMRQSDKIQQMKKNECAKLDQLNCEAKSNHQRLLDVTNDLLEARKEKHRLSCLMEDNETFSGKNMEVLRQLSVDYECAVNREKNLLIERSQIDFNARETTELKKHLQDANSRLSRQLNVELRNLKRTTLSLESMKSCMEQLELEHRKVTDMLRSFTSGKYGNDLDDLMTEIKKKKKLLECQRNSEGFEAEKVKDLISKQEMYIKELFERKKEVQDLNVIISLKIVEKNSRTKDFLKTKQQLREAESEVKLKQQEINDRKSELQKLNRRYKQISELYNLLRGERNKLSKLFIDGGQNVLELEDKVKLQQNEVQILKSSSLSKEGLLERQHVAYLASTLAAEKLRSELSGADMGLADLHETCEKRTANLRSVDKNVAYCRKEIARIRKNQKLEEFKLQECRKKLTEAKISLERESEKKMAFENIIKKGDVTMSFRVEEVKMLQARYNDLQRIVGIQREKLKNKSNVENKLTSLQIQVSHRQDHLLELEKKFIDCKNEKRFRFLEGKDLNEEELNEKLTNLIARITKKTKEVKEKDIIYQKIFGSTKQAWEEIKLGKDESLALAKQGSLLKSQVTQATFRTMALVAELSMRKAETMHLEKLLEEKKKELQLMEENLRRGTPPSESEEKEMKRLEKIRNSMQP